MRTRLLLMCLGLLFAASSAAQEVDLKITLASGGITHDLRFGLDPSATDGLDAALGEEMAPPPPPPPQPFTAQFILPDNTSRSRTDFRQGGFTSGGEVVYRIELIGVQQSVAASWNLPPKVKAGKICALACAIQIPMIGQGSGTIPGGLSEVEMTIEYDPAVLPVELTSFRALTEAFGVVLTWTTVSETNNAGFEVQRKQGTEFEKRGFVEGHGTTVAEQAYRFRIGGLDPGRHVFRLKQIDYDGAFEYSPEVEVEVEVPRALTLSAAYPNPFNPSTEIGFTVPASGQAEVRVYDLLGREVGMLFDGQAEAGRFYRLRFEAGERSSGVYLYTLRHNGQVKAGRMMLVK